MAQLTLFNTKSTSPRYPQTPEELALREAVMILEDVAVSPSPLITRHAIDRVKDLVNPVLDVVSDYAHMRARIEELTSELDDRDSRIAELEEALEFARPH